MPPRRRLQAVPDNPEPPRERAPDLRDAVKAALDKMSWLGPSEGAMKALALRQAEMIETAIDRAEELAALYAEAGGDKDIYKRLDKLASMCDVAKLVGWLGPQLQGVLRDLGGTPGARKAMSTDKPVGGRLDQIRKDAATAKDAAARQDDAEDL